jgi:hypothetical protein
VEPDERGSIVVARRVGLLPDDLHGRDRPVRAHTPRLRV